MQARIVFSALVIMVLAVAGPVRAEVIVQQQSFDADQYSATFSQFNPTNGILQGVSLTLSSASLNPLIEVSNSSGAQQSGNITISVDGLLHASSLPGSPFESVAVGSETVPVTLAPYASTVIEQPLSAAWDPATITFTSPSVLADFAGTGTVTFNAFFGEGYLQASSNNAALATSELGPVLSDSATLDYMYAIDPEPASVILFGVGGLLLAAPTGFHRWRKKGMNSGQR